MTRFDDSKTRFSDRVDAYVRTRPDYPTPVLDWLTGSFGLGAGTRVADIGAGTGIFSLQLASRGARVFAVEPNPAMRQAIGEGSPGSVLAVDGSAEATSLSADSVDGIVAAQAFHWFDAARFGTECRRILTPGGWAAMIWNNRRTDGTPFLVAYERFLRVWGTDYARVGGSWANPEPLARFFGRRPTAVRFDHVQRLDLDGMLGRLESSSYMPGPDHERYMPMRAAATELFHRHERGGRVEIDYDTLVFAARI